MYCFILSYRAFIASFDRHGMEGEDKKNTIESTVYSNVFVVMSASSMMLISGMPYSLQEA